VIDALGLGDALELALLANVRFEVSALAFDPANMDASFWLGILATLASLPRFERTCCEFGDLLVALLDPRYERSHSTFSSLVIGGS
jgi:hypothetical protein